MSILDKVFYKRLEKIRKELDSYIDSRLVTAEHKLSDPAAEIISEKKKSDVQEKFLNYMNLCDDGEEEYDDDYLDEAAAGLILPKQEAEPKKSARPKAAGKPSVHISLPGSMVNVLPGAAKIPKSLKKDREPSELDKVLAGKEETFSEMLLRMIDEKGLKDSDVYKRANIDRRLFSKIRGDEDYVPSKKTAISFCFALRLDMAETKRLLEAAGYALSASSRFDLIIKYLLETQEYNIHFVNIVLDDYGEGTLSR